MREVYKGLTQIINSIMFKNETSSIRFIADKKTEQILKNDLFLICVYLKFRVDNILFQINNTNKQRKIMQFGITSVEEENRMNARISHSARLISPDDVRESSPLLEMILLKKTSDFWNSKFACEENFHH